MPSNLAPGDWVLGPAGEWCATVCSNHGTHYTCDAAGMQSVSNIDEVQKVATLLQLNCLFYEALDSVAWDGVFAPGIEKEAAHDVKTGTCLWVKPTDTVSCQTGVETVSMMCRCATSTLAPSPSVTLAPAAGLQPGAGLSPAQREEVIEIDAGVILGIAIPIMCCGFTTLLVAALIVYFVVRSKLNKKVTRDQKKTLKTRLQLSRRGFSKLGRPSAGGGGLAAGDAQRSLSVLQASEGGLGEVGDSPEEAAHAVNTLAFLAAQDAVLQWVDGHGSIEEDQLQLLFDIADDSSCGLVDLGELRAVLPRAITNAEVAAIVDELDLDDDGRLAFDEFRNLRNVVMKERLKDEIVFDALTSPRGSSVGRSPRGGSGSPRSPRGTGVVAGGGGGGRAKQSSSSTRVSGVASQRLEVEVLGASAAVGRTKRSGRPQPRSSPRGNQAKPLGAGGRTRPPSLRIGSTSSRKGDLASLHLKALQVRVFTRLQRHRGATALLLHLPTRVFYSTYIYIYPTLPSSRIRIATGRHPQRARKSRPASLA